MKKNVLMKVFLILLPAMAVALGTTSDSVMVWYAQSGVFEAYSYFDLIPVTNLQICTPLAGLLAAAVTILAIIYVVKGSRWAITYACWTSFIAASIAVIPVLIRGDVVVVPNVGFPIMMLVEYLLALVMKKKAEELKEKPNNKRLKARK